MKWQQGLTKFEFSVALAVIGMMAAIALQRYIELQELAEKAKVEATLRNIQSGLVQEMARRIIRGEDAQVGDLQGGNPVRWLEDPPEGYRGEFSGRDTDLPSGAWMFEREGKEFCYQPSFSLHLWVDGSSSTLCWQVRRPRIGELKPFLAPVGIMAVRPYQWF